MNEILQNISWDKLLQATTETIYMTVIATGFTFVFGLLLGLALFLTSDGQLFEQRATNRILSFIVNVGRSIPFIILIVLLIPFTKLLVGTMLGANAALPALIIGAAPFYARMVEMSLREIDKGVIEASQAMGASPTRIVTNVLVPEALPGIVSGITVTAISLIGYTAIAGVVGAGGLGNLAYMEGFQRGNSVMTIVATIAVLILVFIIQFIGDRITARIDKR